MGEEEIRWCNQAFVDSALVILPEDQEVRSLAAGPGFEVVVVTVDMADTDGGLLALSELPGGLAAITPAGGVYDCRNDDMQALRTAAVAMLAVPGTGGSGAGVRDCAPGFDRTRSPSDRVALL